MPQILSRTKLEPLLAWMRLLPWRLAASVLLWMSAFHASVGTAQEPGAAQEHALKAAFVYNFVKFTTWPREAIASPSAPLVIAVMGDDRLASSLRTLTQGRSVHGHRIEVRAVSSIPSGMHAQVLYVGAAQDGEPEPPASAYETAGLLTIGETDRFVRAGGVIRLVRAGDRLQFEIDTAQAGKLGLSFSSQMLMLARRVHGPGASGTGPAATLSPLRGRDKHVP